MAKRARFLTGIIILFSIFTQIFAQNTIRKEVNLRFTNSITGYAVQPEEVIVYHPGSNQIIGKIESFQIEQSGETTISLPHGEYWLVAGAQDFYTISTRLYVGEENVSQVNLHLDPIQPPAELESAHILSLLRRGATLVTGFVTDDRSGRPLSNVRISFPENNLETFSNNRGYFLIYLPSTQLSGTLLFEKTGYVSQERINIELWAEGDWQYRLRLITGEGKQIFNDGKSGRSSQGLQGNGKENCEDCDSAKNASAAAKDRRIQSPEKTNQNFPAPVLLPNTIRLGRNCPGPTSCTTVEVYTLQTYCKYVLPAEWFSCWGSLGNGMNSLQAGAVAIRSYAAWHVYNPLTSSYDICDNTFCQFFGNTLTSNCNTAVDVTERYVLVNSNDVITRSEYSAENNNSGCGNGWSGTGTTWPCIYDPVCTDMITFGHGRGMCQRGSARWANGTRILTTAPCASGIPHGFGAKTWQEILDHYYPDYQLAQAAAASIVSAAPMPSLVAPGQTFSVQYTVQAAPAMSLMLGASVRPSSGGSWIDDPANDLKINVIAGTSTISRPFHLPGNASLGAYDLLAALWYDVDENNQINSGDFVLDLEQFNQAFTVGPSSIERLEDVLPTNYSLSQNYPNPFNPRTAIEFSLPQSGTVALTIYDALGKEVAALVNRFFSAGRYRISWDAENFTAGIYFYRLSVDGNEAGTTKFVQTKKLVLAK